MENQNSTSDSLKNYSRIDKSKIYFFVIAIIALLVTNVFYFVKLRSSGDKLYTIDLQKEELHREIDRAEAELDNIYEGDLTDKLSTKSEEIRSFILSLRTTLDDVNVSSVELDKTKVKILELKNNVIDLQSLLASDNLQKEMVKIGETYTSTDSVEEIDSARNSELSKKEGVFSSIKVSNISVNGLRLNNEDTYDVETKAKRVASLQIKFTVVENVLAKVGQKNIYVRIVNPQGNLIANSSNYFKLHDGRKLQYTFKKQIHFTNNGEEYDFIWRGDNTKFTKGTYTVLLYTDGFIMGRSSVLLK